MTDLTEKWKKGELPSGWYWVDYYSVDGAVMLEYIPQHNGFGYEEKNLVQRVISQVPIYKEYQSLLKDKELWIKRCNNARKHQFNAMKDAKTIAQTLLKVSPEHKAWLEKHYGEYL